MKYFFFFFLAISNKTAIHNIIKDTVENIPESKNKLLLLGKPYKYSGSFGSGLPRLMRWALKAPRLFILARRFLVPLLPNDNRPIFLFDPLYLLFYRNLTQSKIMVLDLTPITRPEWHGTNVAKLYNEAFRQIKNLNLECHSISESTREDLRTVLKINEDKNLLLYIYANKKFQPHEEPVFSKQILFVGSFEPRKNLTGLIQGFQKSNLGKDGYSLHIVGAATTHYENVKADFLNDKSIVFHGYLSDAELHAVYQNTQVFAYPSHWEGFGVPLLEAMNMKIASFASITSACPEVGGPAMKYVDPKDTSEIAEALSSLCKMTKDEYLKYTETSWQHAQKFSFEKYIQTLEKALQ